MPKANHYGLILAGGRGTRFWPRSRKKHAKQVLSFTGERTLIQETVDRLRPLLPPERIWILTNGHLRDEIVAQLPEIPAAQIMAEPAQRNTAPAIGLMAKVIDSIDPNAVFGVFPADHLISDPAGYLRLIEPAFEAGETGQIAVLGIQPRWAETGYGYIQFPAEGVVPGLTTAYPVERFREKPNLETAEEFVRAGNFFWNAGMFFWKTGTVLEAMRTHLPKTATLLESLPPFGADGFEAALSDVFPRCENISIDYAVIEKAKNVVGLAANDIGWNDVGSWNAVYELLEKDADGNVLRTETMAAAATGSYVEAPGKLVALIGVKDLIVVDTKDALLIADRSRAQEVGDIVKALDRLGREELL